MRKTGSPANFWRLHRLLWAYFYWKGVRSAVPSWREWMNLTRAAAVECRAGTNAGRLGEQFP